MEKGTLIGKGREAEVLYWGDNKVLKLFRDEILKERIEFEFKASELVCKYYKYAPKVYEKIEVNNREGIIYEFIDGKPMTDVILKQPLKIRKLIKNFAELHIEMHNQVIPEIISQKIYFEHRIQNEQLLSENQKQKIIKHLRNLPGGILLCHGDFHPYNVLISVKGLFVIDWSNLTAGNHHADIARTLYLIKGSYDPSSSERSTLVNFIVGIFRSYMRKKYFRNYSRFKKVSLKKVREWNLIIYAVRLGEEITEEQDFLLKEIDKELKKLHL